ncbi:MAG: Maf family protein [Ilumatobacteraceae bacterium]
MAPRTPSASIPTRVILASASPRRKDLLDEIGLSFIVVPSDIDESVRPGEAPVDYVRRLAVEKATVATTADGDLVIAADTTVDVDGEILAKPDDQADARRMLKMLSGRAHRVHTGLAVRYRDQTVAQVGSTFVKLQPITDEMMEWYLATGESMGKAGAYAIQGEAAVLVDGIQGSITNVIGLPLALLDQLMSMVGVSLAALADV